MFHASFNDQVLADEAVIKISRGASVILLLTYALYMVFQLVSHKYLYAGTPQHIIDEQTQPGILQRMHSTNSTSSEGTRSTSVSTVSSGVSGGFKRRVKRKAKAKLGRRRHTKTEEEVIDEEQQISPHGPAPLPSDAAKPSRGGGAGPCGKLHRSIWSQNIDEHFRTFIQSRHLFKLPTLPLLD